MALITIGTRSSKLALWQANHVKAELHKFYPALEVNLKEIKTKGDCIRDVALSKIGRKGLFTKEIEEELLKCEIDIAVHSLKDLPTKLPKGLKIGAVLKREDPHDVLITRREAEKSPFKNLPRDTRIGTSSLRRIAQLKAIKDDLEYLDLRGNLDTRIKKLDKGLYDAVVLAYAGVKRLGFEERISEHFDPKVVIPAVGQGSMAIEIRENDEEIEKLISKLNDEETFLCSMCERSFLETLQGGCQVPIGAYSEIKGGEITFHGIIASLDGKCIVKNQIIEKLNGDDIVQSCKDTGKKLAEKLLQNGGDKILMEIRKIALETDSIDV